jgi:aminoglycoside phosphotransferase (APT) family kinase protein
VVLKTGPIDVDATRQTTQPVAIQASMATEAAALTLAENHRLPVPRLIAHDLVGECGRIALLTTAALGNPSAPDDHSIRALGELLPKIHAVKVPSDPALPVRVRAREGDDYVGFRARQRGDIEHYRTGISGEQHNVHARVVEEHPNWPQKRVHRYLTTPTTTPLIEQAERLMQELPHNSAPTGLVHNDIAPGNVIWTDDSPVLIDWEGAGAGPTGLDLGNARFELALHRGTRAADLALEGWRRNADVAIPDDLPYWDLSAALNTPANLTAWSSNPDATERRDAFISHVLTKLARVGRYNNSAEGL